MSLGPPGPTAPVTFPGREASLGLALMDLSVRLDHLPRLSEHLTLMDRGHMSRSISVDVDLDLISGRLRDTLLVPAEVTPGRTASLWVPVSRYSRRDLAPVVIRDSSGEVVPRLTHRDANRVTAAAFVRLLSMLVNAHEDVSIPDTAVHRIRHTHQRSHWLIEAAITELVTVGSPSGAALRTPLDYAALPPAVANGRASDSRSVRDLALTALDALFPAGLPGHGAGAAAVVGPGTLADVRGDLRLKPQRNAAAKSAAISKVGAAAVVSSTVSVTCPARASICVAVSRSCSAIASSARYPRPTPWGLGTAPAGGGALHPPGRGDLHPHSLDGRVVHRTWMTGRCPGG